MCMSSKTRSGLRYREATAAHQAEDRVEVATQEESSQQEDQRRRETAGEMTAEDGIMAMLRAFKELEEQRRRAAEELDRRERLATEERERWEQLTEEEREKQEREHAESMRLLQHQMEALRGLVEYGTCGEAVATRTVTGEWVKIAKLTEQDKHRSVSNHLREVGEDTWAIRLAPQLIGKAQQAYAAMRDTNATNYQQVKDAILKRYNISEETYRQHFRAAKQGVGETYSELVVGLKDLMTKWTASCWTIQEIREKFTVEQLLKTMPTDLRVWVAERKPTTAAEAGKLADDYLQARRQVPKTSNIAEGQVETRRCHWCHVEGHLAHNCPQKKMTTNEGSKTPKHGERTVRCYSCGKQGHISMHCPQNVLSRNLGASSLSSSQGQSLTIPNTI